ncbi:MAG TPA: NACHT domain-containing protein [Gemmatimonadales bacterium]|nr:NACHT domain-containing protein [Gemmatimonadales bacterium]
MTLLQEIERDIRAFADPGSPILVEAGSAVWEQNGREMAVRFSAAGPHGFPDVTVDGLRLSYRAFLSGPRMADLARFAQFVVKAYTRTEEFIDTEAVHRDEDTEKASRGPATTVVLELATENLPFLSTRVVLVRGEAGSGKTIALRGLSLSRAERFAKGAADSLFFYVDAQGRALSRLEDAMAKDLQDLRSQFSYAAIAPLTRHGLIVPIIDGFDELLGSGGYDEAFSSLAAFLSTLEGRGSIVASARSAFFDYQNFYENAQRFAGDGRLNYEVETVDVESWNDDQIRKYFRGIGARKARDGDHLVAALEQLQVSLDTQNKQLLTKPFYASRVADLLAGGTQLNSRDDLLDQLVDAFLEREYRKLLDKDGRPLLSKKGHRAFLTGLAEEMWWQESRRIDVGTVQVLAELVTDTFSLPPGAARAIVERVSSYAFLSTDHIERRFLRFEHEVFYGYFLAQKVQEFVEREPADLRRFLARAVLDDILVDEVVRLIGSDVQRCSRAIESICDVLRPGVSEVVARENAGMLIAGLMRGAKALRDGLLIKNTIFRQVSFGGVTLTRPRFEQCDFADVDLSGARLIEPEFVDTQLRSLEVDVRRTRIEIADALAAPQVYGIRVQHGPEAGAYYSPEDIERILAKVGMKFAKHPSIEPAAGGYAPAVQRRVDILNRFMLKMERRFYASADDIGKFSFATGPDWEVVRGLLKSHQLLKEEFIEKRGPREPLVRLAVPPAILRRGENVSDRSVPDAVKDFWRDLVASG